MHCSNKVEKLEVPGGGHKGAGGNALGRHRHERRIGCVIGPNDGWSPSKSWKVYQPIRLLYMGRWKCHTGETDEPISQVKFEISTITALDNGVTTPADTSSL